MERRLRDDMYQLYGDVSIIVENYESMIKWMNYVKNAIENGEWFKMNILLLRTVNLKRIFRECT